MDVLALDINNIDLDDLIHSSEFREFTESLDNIRNILIRTDDLYIEAVENLESKSKRTRRSIVSNTVQTTRQASSLIGTATDAGGSLIKTGWDISMKLIGSSLKIVHFIIKKIIEIPKIIGNVANKVINIPKGVLSKVRGDIQLYISAQDIESLFNNGINLHLENFSAYASQFSKGDCWTTLVKKILNATQRSDNKNRGTNKVIKLFSKSDLELCDKLQREYKYFKNLEFKKSTINMSNPDLVNLYLGDGKITINDNKAGTVSNTYYDMLKLLTVKINSHIEFLKTYQNDISSKFNRTQANFEFSNLSKYDQDKLVDTMRMISKAIEVIGNLTRYTIADMETIRKTADEILSRQSKLTESDPKKLIGKDKIAKGTSVNDTIKDGIKGNDDVDLSKNGYTKIHRYTKSVTGKEREFRGIVDKNDKNFVWVPNNAIPSKAKYAKS